MFSKRNKHKYTAFRDNNGDCSYVKHPREHKLDVCGINNWPKSPRKSIDSDTTNRQNNNRNKRDKTKNKTHDGNIRAPNCGESPNHEQHVGDINTNKQKKKKQTEIQRTRTFGKKKKQTFMIRMKKSFKKKTKKKN